MKKTTPEDFVIKANAKHKGFYSYEMANFTNVMNKITITCPVHGFYEQRPDHHLAGRRCKKCSTVREDSTVEEQKISFLKAAIIRWKGKYSYDKVVYTKMKDKVIITCPIHGDFEQAPDVHRRSGCEKCGKLIGINKLRMTLEDFIIKARLIHYDKYQYIKLVNKSNAPTSVEAVCSIHGNFVQKINNHLNGKGCQKCGLSSTGEQFVSAFLDDLSIKYKREMTFDDLINDKTGNKLRLDFFISSMKIAIEYDGKQHFEVVSFWGNTKETLAEQRYKDSIKTKYCKENAIHLVRLNYKMNRMEQLEILNNLFSN